MQYVATSTSPEPLNPRVLAGKAVRDLIAYRGMTIPQAGQVAQNLSTPTIRRIVRGDPKVGDGPLQAMAGVLNLPINLFLLIIAEDRAQIAALAMPDHIKDHVLTLLSTQGSTVSKRKTDRHPIAKD